MPGHWVLWPFSLLFSCFPLSRAVYQWPSAPYETLEQIIYEGINLVGSNIAGLAMNCERRRDQLNLTDPLDTTVAAQWLRLAYHDMSTHNVAAGTGGIDASIYYELNRAESIGKGMTLTMIDFSLSSNKYLSRADIIAVGTVLAVASSGGPILPFRGGLLDAFAAGRPGVPEPQQDLDSHIENSRLQGFNATETIFLVACGHTFGGVRNWDFPETVPLDKEDPSVFKVATFDSTIQFDVTVMNTEETFRFWFKVDDLGNGTKVIQQNSGGNGAGYQMPPHAGETMHVPSNFRVFKSKDTFSRPLVPNTALNDYIVTAAIRTELANSVIVLAKLFDNTFFNATGPTAPFNATLILSRNASAPPMDGYTFYSAPFKKHIGGMATVDFELHLKSNARTSTGLAPRMVLDFVLLQPVDMFSILAPFANTSTTTAPLPSSASPPNLAPSSWAEHSVAGSAAGVKRSVDSL